LVNSNVTVGDVLCPAVNFAPTPEPQNVKIRSKMKRLGEAAPAEATHFNLSRLPPDFVNHIAFKKSGLIPRRVGARVTTNSEIIAFPAKNRIADVKRCAVMLDRLHGAEANDFWRNECRELAAHLTRIGYEDAAMRQEIMEFQEAVQAELWANVLAPEARRDSN